MGRVSSTGTSPHETTTTSGSVTQLLSGTFTQLQLSGLQVVEASGAYYASGVGVQVQSGLFVSISGQINPVQSGVIVASGLGVLISGQMVAVASGMFFASGIGVITSLASGSFVSISGQGVLVQSGLFVSISGQTLAQASGAYNASGVGVVVQSGLFVSISGQFTYQGSGAFVSALVSGTVFVVQTSGMSAVESGEVHIMSGFIQTTSGSITQLLSGTFTQLQLSGLIVASGSYVNAETSGDASWVASGQILTLSGSIVSLLSGAWVVAGFASGSFVSISGQGVLVQSGLFVSISGQQVVEASGAYYASGIGVVVQSGLFVSLSGQTVQIASGLSVVVFVASGAFVSISGQFTYQGSGAFVSALVSGTVAVVQTSGFSAVESGEVHILSGLIAIQSGFVTVQSGVIVASGLGVLISGQMVALASGAYLASGLYVVAGAASGSYIASGIYGISQLYDNGVPYDARLKNTGLGLFSERWSWVTNSDLAAQLEIFRRDFEGRGGPDSAWWLNDSNKDPSAWTSPIVVSGNNTLEPLPQFNNSIHLRNSIDGATWNPIYLQPKAQPARRWIMRIDMNIPTTASMAAGVIDAVVGFEVPSQGAFAGYYINIGKTGVAGVPVSLLTKVVKSDGTLEAQQSADISSWVATGTWKTFEFIIDPPYIKFVDVATPTNFVANTLSEDVINYPSVLPFFANECGETQGAVSGLIFGSIYIGQVTAWQIQTTSIRKTITLLNSGATIATSGEVHSDVELQDELNVGVTTKIIYGINALGVRVYLLASPDNFTTVDTEDTVDAFGYYTPIFLSGQTIVKSVNVGAAPKYLRIMMRNLGGVATSGYAIWLTRDEPTY